MQINPTKSILRCLRHLSHISDSTINLFLYENRQESKTLVPFQGFKYRYDSSMLTLSTVLDRSVDILDYFTDIKSRDESNLLF